MMDLSIIITSYNTKELISGLLKSLYGPIEKCKQYKFNVEVILVDNNSSDGTGELFQKKPAWLKVIINKTNVGYSAANNIGIRKSDGRYVLLLNSDTVVFPDTFLTMIEFMDNNPDASASTCRVELPDGKIDPASHRGFPTPWNAFCYFTGLEFLFPKLKFFSGYHQGWQDLNKIHRIDSCTGAFFMVKKSVIAKVGLLDDRFFMYGEDLDWAYRMKEAGFKMYYNPNTKIVHYKKQSGRKKVFQNKENKEITSQIMISTSRNFYETMKIFYDKHYKNKYPRLIKKAVFGGIWLISKFKK